MNILRVGESSGQDCLSRNATLTISKCAPLTSSDSNFETIRIPSALYKRIAAKLAGSEFSSVDEWIVQLVENEVEPEQAEISERDEANIREKLKALGYE